MKIKTLEKKRKSILTDDLDYCIECGKRKQHLHEVYFGKNRTNSMLNDCVIPLCNECHYRLHNLDHDLDIKYKKLCQEKFEENHTREEFMNIFYKNYL